MRYNLTLRHNAIPCNAMLRLLYWDALHRIYNTIYHNAIQCNAMLYNTTQDNAMPPHRIEGNAHMHPSVLYNLVQPSSSYRLCASQKIVPNGCN